MRGVARLSSSLRRAVFGGVRVQLAEESIQRVRGQPRGAERIAGEEQDLGQGQAGMGCERRIGLGHVATEVGRVIRIHGPSVDRARPGGMPTPVNQRDGMLGG